MEKLLVLTGSLFQEKFVKHAKELGYCVGVVDMNDRAPAFDVADAVFNASAIDIEAINNIIAEFKPDGITTGICDIPIRVAAKVCKSNNYPFLNEEIAEKATNKYEMIEAFYKNNVAAPFYKKIKNIDEIQHIEFPFPLIVKPVDGSGSRGINLVENEECLLRAIENSLSFSGCGEVLIEEYLEGPEVSVELLIQNGKPEVLQVTDKITTGAPKFIEMGHMQPSSLPEQTVYAIKKLACNAAMAIGLDNCAGHAEIIVTNEGPKMVEIGGRLGADFITTDLLPTSTKVDLVMYEINKALGHPVKFERPKEDGVPVAVRFIPSRDGILLDVKNINNAQQISDVRELKITANIGEKFENSGCNNDRIGYVIATGKTAKIAMENCNKAIDALEIVWE